MKAEGILRLRSAQVGHTSTSLSTRRAYFDYAQHKEGLGHTGYNGEYLLKSPLGDLGATNLKRRKGGRAERQKGLGNDFLMSIMINCV